MISESGQRMKYIIGDYLSSVIAWFLYTWVRYAYGRYVLDYAWLVSFEKYLRLPAVESGFLIFPILMMVVYALSGYYVNVYRKSRLHELFVTLLSVLVIEMLIFASVLVNDMVNNARQVNYEMLAALYFIVFGCVYVVRLSITTIASNNIKNRRWKFPALIVGTTENAVNLHRSIESMNQSNGYDVRGFVRMANEAPCGNSINGVTVYEMKDISDVVTSEGIKEVIVAPGDVDVKTLLTSINSLFSLSLPIKITPNMYNILLSRVRIGELVGMPLMDISESGMSDSGKAVKRALDIAASAIGLLILMPLFAIVSVVIKFDSPGSVLYKQIRVGKNNRRFEIYKFRSMYDGVEAATGPALSSDNDTRITMVGHFLRKYRIDELPQLWNVFIGDMSIVGPRPERPYYVEQIMQRAPFYALVHRIRPGLTSLGMVKFGYAKSVDEMVERLKYDLLYIENMTLLNDFKIMIYTVITIFQGKGI